MTNITQIQQTIDTELAKENVLNALVATTFKGLSTQNLRRALMEGMMRGFTFQDFLEKNIYAIPFKDAYSLVTSIDHARKIGQKNGVVGSSDPVYEEKDGKIIKCTITVKKKVKDYVGEFTATVYFDEYNTGRSLWVNKPRTMIAKVAEMHALRKACPEELSQSYVEEEYQKESEIIIDADPVTSELRQKIADAKSIKDLKDIYEENKGIGKEFTKLLTDKKKEIQDAAWEPKK